MNLKGSDDVGRTRLTQDRMQEGGSWLHGSRYWGSVKDIQLLDQRPTYHEGIATHIPSKCK